MHLQQIALKMSIGSVRPAHTRPTWIAWSLRVWQFLTGPSAKLVCQAQRRQAQFLSALILGSLLFAPIGLLIIRQSVEAANGTDTSIFLAASIAGLIGAYALSRTEYYLRAAAIALALAPFVIFSMIAASPDNRLDLLRYLIPVLLICGMMYSARITLLVALLYLGSSVVFIDLLLRSTSPDRLYALVFMVIGSALILIFIRYRDMTENDRQTSLAAAQDELRSSRELYRTLAKNLPQSSVLLYDRDLRYLLAEGVALAETGYSKEMLEGKTLSEVAPPETVREVEADYRAALAGEERIVEREMRGEIYRIHYLPVRSDSGEIVGGMLLAQNVNEQRLAEAALRESEERYRLMAENSTDLISVQQPDGIYLYTSPASAGLLGYDPGEMIGHPAIEFLHPDDVERVRRVTERTLSSEGVTTIAYRIRRKNGSYTWLESASRPIRNPAGEQQIVTASRDVSDRMEANEALRRSEEQFRSLVASMDSLVFSIDLEGKFLVYHPMPSSIYDTPFDTDVFVGKHYKDVLPDALSSKLDEAVSAAMSLLSTQLIEYSREEDGEEHFYSARISPMIGENLQLLGSTVGVNDVSEAIRARKRQQRLLALEKIQREIGMLFLESDDPQVAIDKALEIMGTSLDVSRAYMFRLRENERLLDNANEWCAPGVSPEKHNLQGLAYDELFPSLLPMLVNDGIIAPEHIRELAPDLSRALAAQSVHSVLYLPFYVDQRLDGFIGFDEMRRPRRWQPEEIAAARMFVQSCARVFERQRAQMALIEARDAALRSARLKSEFVSNMSHEIRTPMTGVIGMLDLMRETELTEDQKEFVEIAHSSANRLLNLIGDILDFSKIEAGKVSLENIPLDVRGVITEVQSLLTLQAGKKGLQLLTDVAEEVPTRVLGDPTRLRQILMNLVGNAIKFTEHGTITIAVREQGATYGRTRLRFEVIDTGVGIPADRQQHIFDSFVQADNSTTRRYGGAGLGLAICKQLVALMGGELDVTSTLGQGSSFGFVLTLPIVALTDRAALNTDFNYLQVLVMDEENSARYLLAEQLRLWGTNVIEASSLDEARTLLVAMARREEEVEMLIFRSQRPVEQQEAMIAQLKLTLGVQMPLLVQLYDDEALVSPQFDMRLRRPVHPTHLYQLLAHHAERNYVPEAEPVRDDHIVQPTKHFRILVADDEPMNRQIVVHALEQFGYTVDIAHNGEEVLKMLDQKLYKIILMDMQMPVMDGLEATRRIRSRDGIKSQVPIIAFTASIEAEQRQRYLDNGISAILGKPFSLRELRQTVEAWLAL